jgi:hypothetical protein
VLLRRLRRRREGLAVLDEIIDRYGEAADSKLRFHSASAFAWKANLLFRVGRPRAAGRTAREFFARYRDAPEPEIRAIVSRNRRAVALINLAVVGCVVVAVAAATGVISVAIALIALAALVAVMILASAKPHRPSLR